MPAFKRLLLRVGLPFGVVAAVVVADSRFGFLLTLLSAALALTAALVVIRALFTKHLRRTTATEIVLCALILGVTFGAGLAALRVGRLLPRGWWQALPATPEPVDAFIGPTCHHMNGRDDDAVEVRAPSGRTYSYHGRAGETGTWLVGVPADSLSAIGGPCYAHVVGQVRVPRAPGRVVASHQIDDDGVDCAFRRYYVLLDSGTILRWSTGSCAYGVLFGGVVLIAILLLLGLVACVSSLGPSASPPWARLKPSEVAQGAT
jgi:hypothetical protein